MIIFLKVEKRDPSLLQDYGRDPQYADASIDAMREQKLAVNEFIIKNHLLLFFLSLGITTLSNNKNPLAFLIEFITKEEKKRFFFLLFVFNYYWFEMSA